MGVDGARDAVRGLDVELGQGILLVNRGIGQIADSRSLDHVANDEAVNGLVLGDAAGAVKAANWVNVASSLLSTSVVAALYSLQNLDDETRFGDGWIRR